MPYSPEPKDIDINSSAAELRNYTLAFVSFLLYVLITATSTTHEQLLRISTVKLPLLNIDIPIVQFYLVSPLLILILHFHLLLQHFLFSQQYYIFDEALKIQYPDHLDRERFMKKMSGNLSLVHLFGGYQKPFMQLLLVSIVAICLLIFPLFDLWFLQAKFLPFHDTDYTNWQCLMVVIDCLMLFILLPKILDENDNALNWWKNIIYVPVILIYRIFLLLLKAVFYLLYKLNILFLSFLQYFFYQSRFTRFRAAIINISSLLTAISINLQLYYQTVSSITLFPLIYWLADWFLLIFSSSIFILSVFVSTLPQFEYTEEPKEFSYTSISLVNNKKYPYSFMDKSKWLLYSNKYSFINDREKWLLQYIDSCPRKESDKSSGFCYFDECSPDASKFNYFEFINNICKVKLQEDRNRESLLLTARLHEKMIEKTDNNEEIIKEPFLYRNISLSEIVITADANLNHELENSLKKDSTLEKIAGINLKNRDLRYANFSNSKLPKADFRKANLQGTNLFNTELQNAELKSADLQGAYLRLAKLQNSNLVLANLQKADLVSAELQGADLSSAQLQGAEMESVKLQGADLSSAQLQGAKMKSTELQGAYLYMANLQGAVLQETHLESAILGNAKLQGADLSSAHLEMANLSFASFYEPNLSYPTNLQSAYLQGVNLLGLSLKDVILTKAHLQGANLSFADLQESILKAVELQGSDLSYAKLIKSQLQPDYDYTKSQLQGANLASATLHGTNLENTELQGAYLGGSKIDNLPDNINGYYPFDYNDYTNMETNEVTKTILPINTEHKSAIRCLTDNPKLPICKQIDDKENFKKVESYLINELACSDKWIGYGIMKNYSALSNKKLGNNTCPVQAKKKIVDYLVNDFICSDKWIAKGMINNYLNNRYNDDFRPEVIALVNNKLTDKSCQGIQELPDDIKQKIQKEAKLLASSTKKN